MNTNRKDKLIYALIDEVVNRSSPIGPSSEEKIHMAVYSEDTDNTVYLIVYALMKDNEVEFENIELALYKNGKGAGSITLSKSETSSFYIYCKDARKGTPSADNTYYVEETGSKVRSNTIVTKGYEIEFEK